MRARFHRSTFRVQVVFADLQTRSTDGKRRLPGRCSEHGLRQRQIVKRVPIHESAWLYAVHVSPHERNLSGGRYRPIMLPRQMAGCEVNV